MPHEPVEVIDPVRPDVCKLISIQDQYGTASKFTRRENGFLEEKGPSLLRI